MLFLLPTVAKRVTRVKNKKPGLNERRNDTSSERMALLRRYDPSQHVDAAMVTHTHLSKGGKVVTGSMECDVCEEHKGRNFPSKTGV